MNQKLTTEKRYWLKHFPADVPHDIDPNRYASLLELFDESIQSFPERRAFTHMGSSLTFKKIDLFSRNFAAWLLHQPFLQRGDRVAIMTPNLLPYPVVLFGILRAGMVVVNVNPLYTARELEHQLKDSGSKAIVVFKHFSDTIREATKNAPLEAIITTQVGDLLPSPKSMAINFVAKYIKRMGPSHALSHALDFNKILKEGSLLTYNPPQLTHQDVAFLQYTGGTTGLAKGAVLTQRNMIANVLQAGSWIAPVLDKDKPEVAIAALPFYHIFGMLANCLLLFSRGAENVLIPNPRDFSGFVKTLRQTPFTIMTGVNTLFTALMNTPGFEGINFSSFKATLAGGMALQATVAKRWEETTGIAIVEAYGLTETSPAACINPMIDTQYNGSVGLPLPSTYVSIRDDEGEELPPGKNGEICIKGPQVMREYWERPKETEDAFFPDLWFRTGDRGFMDYRGYVFIKDRTKDMILVSGFNVYPNEIEEVAVEMDGILEAAAIGVPDVKSGEVVKLIVVKNRSDLCEAEIIKYCREKLTPYKVPRHVEFRKSLPKTNVGKILRRALRPT